MKELYLAHPFDSRVAIRKWELHVEQCGIRLLNPFYDEIRQDIVEIDEGRAGRYEKLIPAKVVERDVEAIKNSDGIIAIVCDVHSIATTFWQKIWTWFFNKPALSFGTIMEIVYAKVVLEKP